ncbi:unnamed protein product [Cuscuta campestris]|uniref:Uncharacterized protein n=1 Tax=Cuscuta campestris TaxID=132261 RepID=A0A484LJI4_9ASTE|nr:unnamed protein product [Cuscuta campestris]
MSSPNIFASLFKCQGRVGPDKAGDGVTRTEHPLEWTTHGPASHKTCRRRGRQTRKGYEWWSKWWPSG